MAACSPVIRYAHERVPAIAKRGSNGARNGRGALGLATRSTSTPAQTIAKATSVPMFTSCSNAVSGSTAAKTATIAPVTIVIRAGVRKT